MKTSYERSIEEFLRSSMADTADDYSYEEQLRYEVATALEPDKKPYYKRKRFLEVWILV